MANFNGTEQRRLDTVAFTENGKPCCACVLLLDISGSMESEDRIGQLNQGLQTFADALRHNPQARMRVEPAIITFSDTADIVSWFVTADDFEPPNLTAGGVTAMGTAVLQGLDILEQRKQVL